MINPLSAFVNLHFISNRRVFNGVLVVIGSTANKTRQGPWFPAAGLALQSEVFLFIRRVLKTNRNKSMPQVAILEQSSCNFHPMR